MKNLILGAMALSLFILLGCEAKPGKPTGNDGDTTKVDTVPAPQAVVPEYNSPESVTSDGEYIYVANVGVKLEPMAKDGDGRIMKLNMAADNWIDKDKWAAIQLNAPKGMAIVRKNLYVADIDRVVVIDLAKTEQAYVYDFSKFNTTFLNDMAVMNDSTLLVSSTDANAIFKINLKDQSVEKMKTGELNGPNGMVYASEENKIYCVEYGSEKKPKGRVLAIDGKSGAVKQIGTHTGGLDGVALTADGSLMFSDWGTAHLEKLNMQTGVVTEVASDSIQGPADFYYDLASKKTYLPRMMGNKLSILEGN